MPELSPAASTGDAPGESPRLSGHRRGIGIHDGSAAAEGLCSTDDPNPHGGVVRIRYGCLPSGQGPATHAVIFLRDSVHVFRDHAPAGRKLLGSGLRTDLDLRRSGSEEHEGLGALSDAEPRLLVMVDALRRNVGWSEDIGTGDFMSFKDLGALLRALDRSPDDLDTLNALGVWFSRSSRRRCRRSWTCTTSRWRTSAARMN